MSAIKTVYWIKMRLALPTNPKVIHMARMLIRNPAFRRWFSLDDSSQRDVTCDEASSHAATVCDARVPQSVIHLVVGALVPMWGSAFERVSEHMVMRFADLATIDTTTGVPGFGQAMASVGWVEVLPNDQGLLFPNLDEHNAMGQKRSSSAKSGAERMRNLRDRRSRADKLQRDVICDVTRDRKVEKKREEKKLPPSPPMAGGGSVNLEKAKIICQAIKAQGTLDANPADVRLQTYIQQDVSIKNFENAARITAGKGKDMSYLYGILDRELREAAILPVSLKSPDEPWDTRRSGVDAMAVRLDKEPWNEALFARGAGENYPAFKRRIQQEAKAAGLVSA